MLPPTSPDILTDDARPYFLWWDTLTVAQFRLKLASDDPVERAYYLGALLREANTRDVWPFVTPSDIRVLWPSLRRHLGKRRAMWAFLLDLPEGP